MGIEDPLILKNSTTLVRPQSKVQHLQLVVLIWVISLAPFLHICQAVLAMETQ